MSKDGTRKTTDYEKFGTIEGNRQVDRRHVREIKALIETNGNLIEQFPIKVNPNMEILDGQHRFEALKELELPIVYEIVEGANINTVRAINLGNKNWNWQDMAQSFYDLGNEEYGWFLRFVNGHKLPFMVALAFANQPQYRGQATPFNQGYLKVEEKTKAVALAEHYGQVRAYVPHIVATRDFALALKLLWQNDEYEEERMIKKIAELGDTLPAKSSRPDYARKLEEIYNHRMGEAARVRLF